MTQKGHPESRPKVLTFINQYANWQYLSDWSFCIFYSHNNMTQKESIEGFLARKSEGFWVTFLHISYFLCLAFNWQFSFAKCRNFSTIVPNWSVLRTLDFQGFPRDFKGCIPLDRKMFRSLSKLQSRKSVL